MSVSSIGLSATYGSGPTTVASIISLKIDGMEKNIFETKTLNQSGRWVGKQGAFVDAKTLSMTVEYTKTQFNALIGILDDEAAVTWTITLPDSSTFACSGLLKSMGLDAPEDGGRITDDIVIELSGAPTFTAGA